MLDAGVRRREEDRLTSGVLPHHPVGRATVVSQHLDNLRVATALSDVVGVYHKAVAYLGFHPCLLHKSCRQVSARILAMSRLETIPTGRLVSGSTTTRCVLSYSAIS